MTDSVFILKISGLHKKFAKNAKANEKSKNKFFERHIKDISWKINKKIRNTKKGRKSIQMMKFVLKIKIDLKKVGCRKLKDIQKLGKEKQLNGYM